MNVLESCTETCGETDVANGNDGAMGNCFVQIGNNVNDTRTTQFQDRNWILVLRCWDLKEFEAATFFSRDKNCLSVPRSFKVNSRHGIAYAILFILDHRFDLVHLSS